MSAILRDQPRSPAETIPGIPIDLEKIIVRYLRKEPERRFQHMDDLKVALQELAEEAQSATPLARPAHPARKPFLRVALVTVVSPPPALPGGCFIRE